MRPPNLIALQCAHRQWLLEQAGREAEGGCARLFDVKSDISMYFADIAHVLTFDQRCSLMRASVKRLCEGNYGYPAVPVTEDEKGILPLFDFPFLGRFRTPTRQGTEIAWTTSGRKDTVDTDKVAAILRWERREFGGDFRVSKSLLKSALKSALAPAFGKPEVVDLEWRFITHTDSFDIITTLDFGRRRPTQFRYFQSILLRAFDPIEPLISEGGLASLLGWPTTDWSYLTDDDIPTAAELVAGSCFEFLEAMPKIWERACNP